MAYTRVNWLNEGETGVKPINKTNLNIMDQGIYDLSIGGGTSGDTLPIGTMVPYGKTTAPTNWLVCDGSAVSRTTYADLFAVIGTSYGAGDGSTTFNLPNKKGKVSVGLDSDDAAFDTIGETGGEKTHTLTINEMPSHTHTVNRGSQGNSYFELTGKEPSGDTPYSVNTSATGGGQAHNNLQPYQVDQWIIKAFQSSGVVANVSQTKTTSSTDVYSCNYVNNLHTYSTTEQLVGNWINGKPIYRKVIDVGTLPNSTSKSINHNIQNIDTIIHIGGYMNNQNIRYYPLPLVYTGASSNYNVEVNATRTAVEVTSSTDRTMYSAYVVLEYTKTTD